MSSIARFGAGRILLQAFLALLISGAIAGCAARRNASHAPPPPTHRGLIIEHQVGGAPGVPLRENGVRYQPVGSDLLVIDDGAGALMQLISFATPRAAPAIASMAAVNDSLFVLLEDQTIIELDIAHPSGNIPPGERRAPPPGCAPRRLMTVAIDGAPQLLLLCENGVVRWRDRAVLIETDDRVEWIEQIDDALYVTTGRRIYLVRDQQYVGSASTVHVLPNDSQQRLLFTRRRGDAHEIGLMNRAFRELPGQGADIAIVERVERFLCEGDLIAIATADELLTFVLRERGVELIARTLHDDGGFVGGQPGRLTSAAGGGLLHALGSGPDGTWRYRIGGGVTRVDGALAHHPQQTATVAGASARISDDRQSLEVTLSDGARLTYEADAGDHVHCVAAIDGRFWIGATNAIHALAIVPNGDGEREVRASDSVVIAGPVIRLQPLPSGGGGAVYVAERGGFGVVRWGMQKATPR